jgi:hypothetical protein
MTEFTNNNLEVKGYAGYALVGITIFSFLVNTLIALCSTVRGVSRYLYYAVKRCKRKIEMKKKTVKLQKLMMNETETALQSTH